MARYRRNINEALTFFKATLFIRVWHATRVFLGFILPSKLFVLSSSTTWPMYRQYFKFRQTVKPVNL
jgi:hypothetical protein